MELNNLIEQSTFLNKYKYLLKLYNSEELNLNLILTFAYQKCQFLSPEKHMFVYNASADL